MTSSIKDKTKDAGLYQGVRCFLSVDLTGSTGLKSNSEYLPTREVAKHSHKRSWVDIHLEFYQACLDELIHFDRANVASPWGHRSRLHFWRIRGDEVLFFSDRVASEEQIFDILERFCKAIERLNIKFSTPPVELGAKGCMWVAGFPIRNREILISNSPPFFRSLSRPDITEELIEDAPAYNYGANAWLEFAGPEIDLGFLLAQHVTSSRVVISIEVANYISKCPTNHRRPIQVHHVGWTPLKTLYDGTPYPILWADARDDESKPTKVVSYEEAKSPFSANFFDESSTLSDVAIQRLNQAYLKDTAKYGRIDMYLKPEDAPDGDRPVWDMIEGQ